MWGMNGPDLPEKEGSETAFTTRCRRMNALDLHHQGTRNLRSRDGTSYDRASGCLYFEFVWSQQVVPELYVVRTVRHPS